MRPSNPSIDARHLITIGTGICSKNSFYRIHPDADRTQMGLNSCDTSGPRVWLIYSKKVLGLDKTLKGISGMKQRLTCTIVQIRKIVTFLIVNIYIFICCQIFRIHIFLYMNSENLNRIYF